MRPHFGDHGRENRGAGGTRRGGWAERDSGQQTLCQGREARGGQPGPSPLSRGAREGAQDPARADRRCASQPRWPSPSGVPALPFAAGRAVVFAHMPTASNAREMKECMCALLVACPPVPAPPRSGTSTPPVQLPAPHPVLRGCQDPGPHPGLTLVLIQGWATSSFLWGLWTGAQAR